VIADRVTRAPHTPASRRAPQRTFCCATSTTPTSKEATMSASDATIPTITPHLDDDDLEVLEHVVRQLRATPELTDEELELCVQVDFEWDEDSRLSAGITHLARGYLVLHAQEQQAEVERLRNDPKAALAAVEEHMQILDAALAANAERSKSRRRLLLKMLKTD